MDHEVGVEVWVPESSRVMCPEEATWLLLNYGAQFQSCEEVVSRARQTQLFGGDFTTMTCATVAIHLLPLAVGLSATP